MFYSTIFNEFLQDKNEKEADYILSISVLLACSILKILISCIIIINTTDSSFLLNYVLVSKSM